MTETDDQVPLEAPEQGAADEQAVEDARPPVELRPAL